MKPYNDGMKSNNDIGMKLHNGGMKSNNDYGMKLHNCTNYINIIFFNYNKKNIILYYRNG